MAVDAREDLTGCVAVGATASGCPCPLAVRVAALHGAHFVVVWVIRERLASSPVRPWLGLHVCFLVLALGAFKCGAVTGRMSPHLLGQFTGRPCGAWYLCLSLAPTLSEFFFLSSSFVHSLSFFLSSFFFCKF